MIPEFYRILDRLKGDYSNSVTFEWLNGVVPIDLTGCKILVQFRKRNKFSQVSLELTETSGITITSAIEGKFKINEIKELNLDEGVYFYDVQITFPDLSVLTPIVAKTVPPTICFKASVSDFVVFIL